MAASQDPSILTRFTDGYSQCVTEVSRYLRKSSNMGAEVQNRLVNHLYGCINHGSPTTATTTSIGSLGALSSGEGTSGQQLVVGSPHSRAVKLVSDVPSARPEQPLHVLDINQNHVPLAQASSSTILSSATPFIVPQPVTTSASAHKVISHTSVLNLSTQTQSGTTLPIMPAPAVASVLPAVNSITPSLQASTNPPAVLSNNVPVLPVQLIPAKLPSGEFVLLMANSQTVPTLQTTVSAASTSIQLPMSSSTITSATISPPAVIRTQTSTPQSSPFTNSSSVVAVVNPQVQASQPISPSTLSTVSKALQQISAEPSSYSHTSASPHSIIPPQTTPSDLSNKPAIKPVIKVEPSTSVEPSVSTDQADGTSMFPMNLSMPSITASAQLKPEAPHLPSSSTVDPFNQSLFNMQSALSLKPSLGSGRIEISPSGIVPNNDGPSDLQRDGQAEEEDDEHWRPWSRADMR